MSWPRTIVRHRRIGQLIRYGAVSIIATLTSMIVLGALVSTRAMPAAWASVVATAAGTVPSFELNRRWVWAKTGRRSVAGELGPFAALSVAGLGASTFAVAAADHWASSASLGSLARTCAVEGASLTAFGVLWVAQFLILDRLLFRSASDCAAELVPGPRVGTTPRVGEATATTTAATTSNPGNAPLTSRPDDLRAA